jgi:hypothetical protein
MTDPGAPARWLIAEFEATDLEEYETDALTEAVLGPFGSVYVQPFFTLKSVMDTGASMHVTASDYADAGRRWL